MSTQTLLNIDVSTPGRIIPPEPAIAPTYHAKSRVASRPTIGTCLIQMPRVAWMAMDVALVCAGAALGNRLFVWWNPPTDHLLTANPWLPNAVLGTSVLIAGCMFGLYEPSTLWTRSRIIVRYLLTISLATLMNWLVMDLFMYSSLSRRSMAFGALFSLLTAPAIRLLAHRAVRYVRRGLLVIGRGAMTGLIVRSIRRGAVAGYRLVGVVEDRPNRAIDGHGESDIPLVGSPEDIQEICRRHRVAEVVVSDEAAGQLRYQNAALACLRIGCRVTNETTFYETTFGEVPAAHISPNWFLAADLKGQRQEHAIVKRLLDAFFAALALAISAPLLPLIALAIRLEDGGPVFYSQNRVGQGGRHFTLYKFRTMRSDAEANGSTWASPNDPRVTRLGRLLRRSRLDEMPQFWNILKGDMSFVGPRPERPEFVEPLRNLIPFFAERHLIKPGLTGWAQINFAYGGSIGDARRKLQLDLYYIKHMSLELDLIILLRTLGTFCIGSR